MSLRDAVKDLRKVAKILDAATFEPQMNELEKFLNGIKIDAPALPPADFLKKLLEKFLRGDENFSSRELKTLPFIIFEPPITLSDTEKILSTLNFFRTRHLLNIVSVYLLNYDGSAKTELLRRKINFVPESLAGNSLRLKKIFASKDKLFGNERFSNMAKLFAQKLSVNDSLETIGLSGFYKASNFIQVALINFFRSNVASLSAQMKLLTELDASFEAYENIFPAVADALIQSVYRAGFFKEQCIKIFYRRLGDPRFGNSRFKWNGVSRKSRDIFCHWLSSEELETFFEIVKTTALDKQWKYREKFWRTYLPYIVNTKIFLGATARNIAARLEGVKLHHGDLQSAEDNQSVFVFQIGRYIFSEWSHNGKLRIHEPQTQITLFDTAEDFFERDSLGRNDFLKNFRLEQIHSSPQTYFWQKKVSAWIKMNCGINKTKNDWELRD